MSDGAMSDSATACEAALVRSYTPTEWHDARKCGYCCAFRDGWDDAVGGVSARPGDIDLDLMRPYSADYAAGRRAALAWMAGRGRGERDNGEVTA